MSRFYDNMNMDDDILFITKKFEETEKLISIAPPEKLDAKHLFERYENELEDKSAYNVMNITHNRFFKQIGAVAAAIVILFAGLVVYSKRKPDLLMKDMSSDSGQQYITENSTPIEMYPQDNTVEPYSDEILEQNPSVPELIHTSSVDDLGYRIDKDGLPKINDVSLDWEELDYYNNKVNTVVVTVDNKTVVLGYLLSYSEPVDPNSTVVVGNYKDAFGAISAAKVMEGQNIITYFAENIGGDTFISRVYSAGYSHEEIEGITQVLEKIKYNKADYIVRV